MNIDSTEEYFEWLPGYKARLKKRTFDSCPAVTNWDGGRFGYKAPVRYKPGRRIGFKRKK